MESAAETEILDLGDVDQAQWNEYAFAQGWSDGFPLVMPTEDLVERFVATTHGDNEPIPPMSPRRVIPTLPVLAVHGPLPFTSVLLAFLTPRRGITRIAMIGMSLVFMGSHHSPRCTV